MGFLHPELLLLALPAAALAWRWRGTGRGTPLARFVALGLLSLALGAPYLRTREGGRDLVIVVDRSRSMPGGGDAAALELIRLAEEERRAGDRVAVVAFGAEPVLERLPSTSARFGGFARALDRDASDLASALSTALELVPEGRPGALLVVSDGESNGRDPLPLARLALARGLRIDVRALVREAGADLSVERLDLPPEVGAGEPFQLSAWVRSDRRVEAAFELERDGALLSSGRRVFEPGLTRMVFRDRIERAGVASYRLRLEGEPDRVPEDDVGLGALLVRGPRPVLLINDDGAEDTLSRALRAAGIPLEAARPESARLEALALSGYRAVVLENVAASRLGAGLEALRGFVLEQGGGLLVTGGRASFGLGGYHLSPVDELLAVSMEMRQEHRKLGVALAIAMDRSGSMAAEVRPGLQKMDLANLGASAAIELLAPIDSVGVIAVDSSSHVIQELTPARDIEELVSRVRSIESMGGGIFVYTALLAAGRMLEGAEQKNRHIVLFSDAADSEEQERCPELVEQLGRMGTTLSVIALGTRADTDARFLEELARLGQGEIYFTNDPSELPRLFAQDTLTMSRATFVEEPAAASVTGDLYGLGELPSELGEGGFPAIAGYNLTFLRQGGIAGVVTADEHRAPLFAFAYRGLGRTAVYTGQVGGTHGSQIVGWSGFSGFFVTALRWLAGQEEPTDVFASVRREGREAVVSVELDPAAGTSAGSQGFTARIAAPEREPLELPLERVGAQRYEARFPLERSGIALGTLKLADGRFLSLPPVALPYSPEFERPPDPQAGERLLRRIARESGGEVAGAAGALFRGERHSRAWRPVTRELILAALLVMLVEIAFRRLQLWGALARVPAKARALGARLRRAPPLEPETVPSMPASAPAQPPVESEPQHQPERASPPVSQPAKPSLGTALERARRAARRELER
ncbi:MAG TPA: VWA domain-containing protein [Planctomycetota bacterium]|nr:VWA domain-containing protein [Planctomycetota bacterium]